MQAIKTITWLKKNCHSPIEQKTLITQNGLPSFVVVPMSQYKRESEMIALLKLVLSGNTDSNVLARINKLRIK